MPHSRAIYGAGTPLTELKKPPMSTLPSDCTATELMGLSVPESPFMKVKSVVPSIFSRIIPVIVPAMTTFPSAWIARVFTRLIGDTRPNWKSMSPYFGGLTVSTASALVTLLSVLDTTTE